MKLWIYIIVFTLFTISTLSANDFSVLSKSGDVTKKSAKKWVSIKTGEKLSIKDQIKIGNKGYIVLSHIKTKKTAEINKPGTLDLKALASDIAKGKQGVSSQLAKYFVDEIASGGDYFDNGNYKEGLEGNLGSVNRGTGGAINANEQVTTMTGMKDKDSKMISSAAGTIFGSDTKMLFVKMPRTCFCFEPNNEFTWYKYNNSNNYKIVIKDRDNKEIFAKSISDTSLVVNLDEIGIQKGANYYWYVETNGISSLEETINYLNNEQSNEIKNTIEQLKSESSIEESPMVNVAIASFLADKNINGSAYNYFQKAIAGSNNSSEYKKIFLKFLIRSGFYEEAKSLIKELENK